MHYMMVQLYLKILCPSLRIPVCRSAWLCLFLGLGVFAGCANQKEDLILPFSYDVKPSGVKHIPVAMAVVMAPEVKDGVQHIEFNCSSKTFVLPVGKELERQARLILSPVVDDLYLVKHPTMALGHADLVIETKAPSFRVAIQCPSKSMGAYAINALLRIANIVALGKLDFVDTDVPGNVQGNVSLPFAVLSGDGRRLYEGEVHSAQTRFTLHRQTLESAGPSFVEEFQQRLTEALQNMAHDMTDSGAVRQYVAALGHPKAELRAPLATLSDVDKVSPSTVGLDSNRFAIVIGIEQYRGQLPKAEFANRDALTMAKYLHGVMGYPEENISVLLNENASLTDVMKYVEDWLPRKVTKKSTVFVYYSGHGAPDIASKEGYLVPYDGDPAYLKTTGYALNRLYEKLGELPASEVIVALDSCFSGTGGRSLLASGMRPVGISLENPALRSGKVAVLSASTGTEASSSHRDEGHGIFTYFLLKGLGGEADQNQDGTVELGELFKYVQVRVPGLARKRYNSEQNPQLLAPPGWDRTVHLLKVLR